MAWKVTDSGSTYVSESTVYRILKREGLIKPAEIVGFKAAKEYRRKTKQPNELWASDCCHLKVIDWGWYYLVTVMDDYSRFILGWDLKVDMAAWFAGGCSPAGGGFYWNDRCAFGGSDSASLG